MNESFRRGVRLGLPYAAAGFLLSLSFGVLAREAGFSAVQAMVTSLIVFAGSAQFAVIAILLGGGGLVPAVAASGLMNARFLPMGIALAPSLPGGPLKRAAQGQAVVDASWVLANRRDGTFDRWLLFGSTAPQYVTWFCGTAVGALAGDGIFNPERLGLDAIFPAFFLVLLIGELKDRHTRVVALVGAVIALALVPFTPAGIPVLAASAAALIGLARR
jgi:4-azaleucine resistance transporter AzlC